MFPSLARPLQYNGYEKELSKVEIKADKLYPTQVLLRLVRLPKAKYQITAKLRYKRESKLCAKTNQRKREQKYTIEKVIRNKRKEKNAEKIVVIITR